jgi:hypothetical protein
LNTSLTVAPATDRPASVANQLATPCQKKLFTQGAEIAKQSPLGEDVVFLHSILCQVGLPRKKVVEREFLRRSGDAWINVQAGMLDEGRGPVSQPLPYGAIPRLALAWMTTYALRHQTREVPIGRSAADFLRLMGMGDDGKRHSSLRLQMHALAACRLQLGFKGRTYNNQPIEQFDAWLTTDGQQRPLWPGVLVLSDSYFRELEGTSVPLDVRALQALKGSALALDVYAWLAQRLHRIKGRGVPLSWKPLREQFGQEYTGKNAAKDFRNKFLHALADVLMVYPQAKVRRTKVGLYLAPSPPPVPKRLHPKRSSCQVK